MKLSAKQLARMLVTVCEGKTGFELQQTIKEFVQFLSDRQELFRAREVIRQIDSVWKEKFGVANLKIETAYPLSEEVRSQLQTIAHGASIEETVDPKLIGGARLRIDDRQIDGSIAGKLTALQRTLSQ